jgi:hypothetical protein
MVSCVAGRKRVRLLGGVGDDAVVCSLVIVDHEPTAYRVVVAAGQFVVVGVIRGEAHAVGVERQLLALVENQVALFLERDCFLSEQQQLVRAANAFKRGWNSIRVDLIRMLPLQPQQHGFVGAVAAAGHGQRAEQLAAHAHDLLQHAVAVQPALGKARRRPHGSHGVRGGRPDADLE